MKLFIYILWRFSLSLFLFIPFSFQIDDILVAVIMIMIFFSWIYCDSTSLIDFFPDSEFNIAINLSAINLLRRRKKISIHIRSFEWKWKVLIVTIEWIEICFRSNTLFCTLLKNHVTGQKILIPTNERLWAPEWNTSNVILKIYYLFLFHFIFLS